MNIAEKFIAGLVKANDEGTGLAGTYLSFDDYEGEVVVKFLEDGVVVYEAADDIVVEL